MPNIIFHIGFPKCASTTLQRMVFKNEHGYLGTHQNLVYEDNYGLQFEQLTPAGPRIFGDLKGVSSLIDKIKNNPSNDFNNQERFILSSELLSNRNMLVNRPIIKFLKKINDKLWTYGDVKVVLVVRNPAQRMVSEYVQSSIYISHASQNDLRDYIEKRLNDSRSSKYDKWVGELQKALGKKNVCVLLMEEIDSAIFWDQLKSFCGLKNFNTKEWLFSNQRANSHSKAHNVWNLRSFSPQKKAYKIIRNCFGLFWPIRLLKSLRSILMSISETLLRNYFIKKHKKIGTIKRDVVRLTPQLEKRINAYYKPQFKRLEKLIDKDLKKFGYYSETK